MQDKKKTKDQKTSEVAKLSRRIADLESLETERKRAVEVLHSDYEQLKVSEMLYRTLVDNMDLGISFIDADHTILMASAAKGKQFNIPTISDYIGKKCFRAFERRKTVCSHCPGVQAMATGQPAEVETQGIRTDGSRYHMRLQAFPVLEDDGTVAGFIEISENITERKKAEQDLRNSEERFRMIFETAQDLIFLKDRDLTFTAINPAMERYFGVSASEVIGKTSATFLGEETGKQSREEDLHVLGGEIIDAEHSFTTKGNPVIHNVIKVPMRNSAGEIIGLCGIARDITERMKAQKALQESESRYRATLNSMGDAIHVIDTDFRFLLFNDAFSQWNEALGLEIDVIGRSVFEIFPFLPDNVRDEYRRVFDTGEMLITEDYTTINGREFITETRKIPIYENGKVTRVVTVIRDVTDRKRAEESVRRAKEYWERTFDAVPDLVAIIDADFHIIQVNKAMADRLNLKPHECIGQICYEAIHGTKEPPSFCPHAQSLTDRLEHIAEVREECLGGDFIVSTTPLFESDGRMIGSVHVARDITERKRMEETLRESEEKYRELINGMNDTAWVIDFDGKFIDVNDAAVEVLGYSREELLAMGPYDIDSSLDAKKITGLIKRMRTDKLQVFETTHTSKDGKTIPVEIKSSLVTYQGNQAILSIARDITGRKQAEEQLRRSEQELSIRNQIDKIFLTVPDDEMYGKVLEIVLEAMQSRYGVFGYLDEDGAMVVPSMTRHIWDQCQVPDKDIVFPRTTWGDSTWPQAVKEKRIIYSNNPSVNVPEGHIDITRHISMPILYQGEAIGLFQVANKEVDYDEKDIQLLETLAEHIAPILHARLQKDFHERERKLAEDALRESAEQYRIITNTSMDGFAKLDLDGCFLDVNEAYCHLLGYSKEELLKMTVADIEAQATPDELKGQAKELMEVGVGRFETRHRCKDGHIIDVEISMTLLRQSGHILVFLRDITKRKQAEEALRESAEKFRIISNTAMDGFSEIDQDGHFLDVNEESCRMSGYSRDEHLTMSISDMEAAETAEKTKSHLQNIIETGSDRFESRIRRKDGRLIDIEASVSFFPQMDHFLIFHRDITERKRAEEKLRESEEHYRRLIEISPEAIIVQQKNKIVLANSAGARLVGAATFEQLIGKSIEYFVHPHYRKAVDNRIRRVIKKQTAVPFKEQKFIRLDGRIIDVEVAVTPFSYQSEPAVQIVARDISERKQAEEHRKESFQRLRRSLEETVSSLAATIEKRDVATAGHQKRVANLACAIAEEMGFSGDQIDGIRMVGLIHDIGKIYVPSDLLNKTSRLNEPEYELFKSHCQVGYDILKTIDFPWPIAPMVLQHHERQDGSGYPQGLYGEDIILEARILAVADVIEAMSGHRPYRPAYSVGDALEEVLRHKDSLYDPEVVDACLRVFYDKGFTFEEGEKTELKKVPHSDQD